MPAQPKLRKVESRHNARVKELRAGLARGARTDQDHIAIEGAHLVREAVRSGLRLHTVFVRSGSEALLDSLLEPGAETPRTGALGAETPGTEIWNGADVLLLSGEVFSSAVTTEHPQGVAALIEPPEFRLEQVFSSLPLLAVAAGLQDPGNLGTLARSAEAFGATGMILLPGTVSLWNAKALRASSGSVFRLPALALPAEEAFAALRARGVRLLAAVARGGGSLEDFSEPVAFLLGNEGAGLPEAWLAAADALVTIPCPGAAESLNAGVAGSVLLYEAARQRQIRSSSSRPALLATPSGRARP